MKKFILLAMFGTCLAGPSKKVLALAERGYLYARAHNLADSPVTIIVDFSLPSSEKRLWLYDLDRHKTLLSTYVSHGKGSGLEEPYKFSNSKNSHKSSLGFFKVLNTYNGKHGLSLKLQGLESSNSSALTRGIVLHSANYVTPSYIQSHKHAGRSWGCFAVPAKDERLIINKTMQHSLLFAYYPDNYWLKTSKFI